MEIKTRTQALELLGLSYRATREEVKSAFHKLATCYHPDVNSDPEATAYYLALQSAYEFLMEELTTDVGASFAEHPTASRTYGNVTVGEAKGYAPAGGSRIIGSREDLAQAATRRAFKEEHQRQEKRLKAREEQRKREKQEQEAAAKRQQIFDDAMARIHAIRAAEITASIIEDVLKNGANTSPEKEG